MSEFIKQQINKRLAELRADCALQREHVRNAFDFKWGQGQYWDDRQSEAQRDRPKDVANADKTLADFIAEHRPIMGADWIGNDHGRLCWDSYLGCLDGNPIDNHYCQLPEGHEGYHQTSLDSKMGWPSRGAVFDYKYKNGETHKIERTRRGVIRCHAECPCKKG